MPTQKESGNPPALDDILGRARNALSRSQQFRANNPQLLAASAGPNNKASQPPQPNVKNKLNKPNVPVKSVKTLMTTTKVPPRPKVTKSPNKMVCPVFM